MKHLLFFCITLILVHKEFAQDIVFPKHDDTSYLSGDNHEVSGKSFPELIAL